MMLFKKRAKEMMLDVAVSAIMDHEKHGEHVGGVTVTQATNLLGMHLSCGDEYYSDRYVPAEDFRLLCEHLGVKLEDTKSTRRVVKLNG